ncbi:TnsA endonuclease N-terminal domain-containing protein [Salinicola sp. V024]|uniref:TnsA endonuclease N-terminal domain-containing protein n=1 Tax=Salinicola sp. V024 TaxID=3459609 RepID=UPI0040451696
MRGRKFLTEVAVERHISQGFGNGVGDSYKPWLRVQDVPSRGRSHRIQGLKVDRVHHVLSDLERAYLLICEFSENVTDIREQYPLLPRETAQAAANSLGVRYARYPGSSVPLVMTTDFLLTVTQLDGSQKLVARTIKYESELVGKGALRTLEKFEIEKMFWNKQGIEWGIITETRISRNLIKNLGLLRKYATLPRPLLDPSLQSDFISRLVELRPYPLTAAECLKKIASRLYISYQDAKYIYLYLVWNKRIKVDLREAQLQMKEPLLEFTVLENNDHLEALMGAAS